jgi:hypothetical protein
VNSSGQGHGSVAGSSGVIKGAEMLSAGQLSASRGLRSIELGSKVGSERPF